MSTIDDKLVGILNGSGADPESTVAGIAAAVLAGPSTPVVGGR